MTPDPVPPARRDEGEELATYRRMLDTVNATLDAEGRRVGIEMGCDTAHWMAEEILGLRAEVERLRKTLQWRDSEVETHRRDSMQAREALAEAVQRAREEAAREERERCAKALQPWIDEPGKGMRAGPGVPPSIRMWAKYMQDEIRRQPPEAPGAGRPEGEAPRG